MSYDASDPRQVRERLNQLRVDENIRAELLRKIMETREGRAWMHSILERTHVWRSSFALDALAMAFSEGERNVGLSILADVMQAAAPQYLAMVKEAEEVQTLERLVKKQTTGDEDDGLDTTAAG
jgi:hypothetical protein